MLAALKQRVAADNASVNSAVLKLLDEALGRAPCGVLPCRHSDLDESLGGFEAGSPEAGQRLALSRFLPSPRVALLPLTAKTADP